MIADETERTYHSDRRNCDVQQKTLICLDACEHPGETLKNTFDYELQEGEMELYGKLRLKFVELAVNEFQPGFGGRLRARGHIVVESLPKNLVKPAA